ncbi:hypothetical protein BDW75DRAFT_58405 [Aspergillus navahoensis]
MDWYQLYKQRACVSKPAAPNSPMKSPLSALCDCLGLDSGATSSALRPLIRPKDSIHLQYTFFDSGRDVPCIAQAHKLPLTAASIIPHPDHPPAATGPILFFVERLIKDQTSVQLLIPVSTPDSGHRQSQHVNCSVLMDAVCYLMETYHRKRFQFSLGTAFPHPAYNRSRLGIHFSSITYSLNFLGRIGSIPIFLKG